eukprot:94244-Rhodomonas_salina.1
MTGMVLRARHDQSAAAIGLCACYAQSGADVAYGAGADPVWEGTEHFRCVIALRSCYAMCGTDIARGVIALRSCYIVCAVLTQRMVLPAYARAQRCPVLT